MDTSSEIMSLTIKFGAKSIALSLPASSKVSDMMLQLQTATDVLPRVQKLIFKGKVLTPDLTLKNAQLTNGSKIMLMAAAGFQSQFPVRSSSPIKRKSSPPKRSTPFKQIPVKSTGFDESRLKAWKQTGVVSLRDSGLQGWIGSSYYCLGSPVCCAGDGCWWKLLIGLSFQCQELDKYTEIAFEWQPVEK